MRARGYSVLMRWVMHDVRRGGGGAAKLRLDYQDNKSQRIQFADEVGPALCKKGVGVGGLLDSGWTTRTMRARGYSLLMRWVMHYVRRGGDSSWTTSTMRVRGYRLLMRWVMHYVRRGGGLGLDYQHNEGQRV